MAFTSTHRTANNSDQIANKPRDPSPDSSDREGWTRRAIDTAFQGSPEDPARPPTKFIGLVRNRRVLVRDPRTTPRWNDISSLLPNNFGRLVDISLAAPDEGSTVHVTVLNWRGRIAQSTCTVFPTPGTMSNPAWPDNCSDFVDLTPPT
jgi:hypothetical protein